MIPASTSMTPSSVSAEPRPAPKMPEFSSVADGRLDGIEGAAAAVQRTPSVARCGQATVTEASPLVGRDIERAAVDGDRSEPCHRVSGVASSRSPMVPAALRP